MDIIYSKCYNGVIMVGGFADVGTAINWHKPVCTQYILFPHVCTWYILFFSSMYWSCTTYILVRTAQKCMFWSTYLSLKVCTWYILAVLNTVCTGMYSVHTLFIDLVLLFFRFCGVHTGTYWGFLCTYFAVSAMFCRPALPCRFACKRFMHWNTYSTKAHC